MFSFSVAISIKSYGLLSKNWNEKKILLRLIQSFFLCRNSSKCSKLTDYQFLGHPPHSSLTTFTIKLKELFEKTCLRFEARVRSESTILRCNPAINKPTKPVFVNLNISLISLNEDEKEGIISSESDRYWSAWTILQHQKKATSVTITSGDFLRWIFFA